VSPIAGIAGSVLAGYGVNAVFDKWIYPVAAERWGVKKPYGGKK